MGLFETTRRWRVRDLPSLDLTPRPDLPPLLRVLLYHRGIRSDAEAGHFLDGALPIEHDALLLPGMPAAVERVSAALKDGELVGVYGDYDVDGLTGAALLTEGLRGLGGLVYPYIPDRFVDGYGLSRPGIDRLSRAGVSLVVSVDCGIGAVDEVAYARALGLDVVILDHHKVPPVLPSATAAVNPRIEGSRYPFAELTGVGVAFKTLTALSDALGRPFDEERALELVALGTVADVAPLLGENRHLVRRGLRALERSRRAGLRALLRVAGLAGRRLSADDIGFGLAPRLNAAGRLGSARPAFDLLLEEDEGRAQALADELNALNIRRQGDTTRSMEIATELLTAEEPGAPLLFLADERLPVGIAGLIAGRLAEQHYRPAIVCERGDKLSRGSARSIPELDITTMLAAGGDLLLRYGGHRQAAGLTFQSEHGSELKRRLLERAARDLQGVDLRPTVDIDVRVKLGKLRGTDLAALRELSPFGEGNPEPTFLSLGVQVLEARSVGDGSHLRLRLKDGRVTWPAIAFRTPAFESVPERVDVVYSVSIGRDAEMLELEVKDLVPCEEQPVLIP